MSGDNMSNPYRIKKVLVTEEALIAIERLVNNYKEEGLVGVKAHYNEEGSTFEFELKYQNKDREGEFFTRTLSINLDNP